MYVGRFSPSPTGPLHMGSLTTALASFLDAKAHQGKWLLRIEDIDSIRCKASHSDEIIRQLNVMRLRWDGEISYQSQREYLYQDAFDQLLKLGRIYPCFCSRKEISKRYGNLIYQGYCYKNHQELLKNNEKKPKWRLLVRKTEKTITNTKETLTTQSYFERSTQKFYQQDIEKEVGDFVIKRDDGIWAYQLAVVVDDENQQITHLVRGADLQDNTPRQIFIQKLLNFRQPSYYHVPLVTDNFGQKLSKQTKAPAIGQGNEQENLNELLRASQHLGLNLKAQSFEEFYEKAIAAWKKDNNNL